MEGSQGFPQSPGQLRALKPSLPIPPVAVVPRVVAELLRLASLRVPRRAGHHFRYFCETHVGARRVISHSLKAALPAWREPLICGEDESWS